VRRLEARPTQKYDSGTAARSAHLRTAPRADGPGPRGARAARLAAHPAARRVRAAPGAFPSLPPCVLPAPQGPLQLVCCARPGVVTSPTTAPTCIGMDAAAAADAGAAAPGGEQLTADKLLEAIKTIKAENPDFGIKRVWTTLKEGQGLEVSEKRVKKIMQENGLTEGGAGGAAEPAAEGGELTAEQQKKKKASQKQKEKAKDKAAFNAWCDKVLADSAHLVEGMSQEKLLAIPPEFRNYDFTGPLRPAYVTKQAQIPEGIGVPRPDYADTSDPVSEKLMRGNSSVDCKEGDDVEGMRLAGRLGREVIDVAGRFLKVGVTGDQIDRIVHAASLERNCYPSPLNYYRFPKSVCVSANEVPAACD